MALAGDIRGNTEGKKWGTGRAIQTDRQSSHGPHPLSPWRDCQRQNLFGEHKPHVQLVRGELPYLCFYPPPQKPGFPSLWTALSFRLTKAWETQTFGEQCPRLGKAGAPAGGTLTQGCVREWHWAVLPVGPSSLRQPPLCPPLLRFCPPSPPPSQPPPPAHSAELAQQDQKNQRHHVRDQQKCLQNGSLMIKRSLQMPSTHPGKGKLETRGGELSTTSQLAPQSLPYCPNGHIFPFRNFLSESMRQKRALPPPPTPPPAPERSWGPIGDIGHSEGRSAFHTLRQGSAVHFCLQTQPLSLTGQERALQGSLVFSLLSHQTLPSSVGPGEPGGRVARKGRESTAVPSVM